jgi:hypothetical protein
MKPNSIQLLREWYAEQCNGVWEHSWGIKIDTLDNPGWSLQVDLMETALQDVAMDPIKVDYEAEIDWMFCRVKENVFYAHCGINRLEEMIMIFIDWAQQQKQGTAKSN